MPSTAPGQTNLVRGTYSDECTTELDLVRNQQAMPIIKKMMWRVDKRQLTTLLTSGAVGPYGLDYTVDDKIGKIKKGDLVGGNSVRFNVMGRIQKPSVILSQVGGTSTDGTFQLLQADKMVYKGNVVVFPNSTRYTAICLSEPTKVAGGWLYTYQNSRETFVFATHVGTSGTFTCFPSTTGYGEGSKKGYDRNHFPDTYVVDMTLQRKSTSITGDAANDILWYEYMGDKGPVRGWKFEQVRQAEARWAVEDEYAKIFGISTLKNADGSRKSVPTEIDTDTGNPIYMGDGLEEQIAGGNEIFGSGTNGEATEDDFLAAANLLTLQSNNNNNGSNLIFMTGLVGFQNAQRKMARFAAAMNIQFHQNVTGSAKIEVGYESMKLNMFGNSVTFVIHPMFDDKLRFPALASDGTLLMSSTYIGGDLGANSMPMIEILAKGGNGGDRSNVQAEFNGMTGLPGIDIKKEEDALTIAWLKQDLLAIYNSASWVVIRKSF